MLDDILNIVSTTAVGAVLAGALSAAVVTHAQPTPDQNPASQQILVYGD